MAKEHEISLIKEAIQHLESDFKNVKTDTGRTIIAGEIEELERKLSVLENDTTQLKPWGVYEFPWGTAVKHEKGNWSIVCINGHEINVEGMNVILHQNGIEFYYS
jgi:hypothetical protein